MEIVIRNLQITDFEEVHSLIKNELGYFDLPMENLIRRLEIIQSQKDYETFVAIQNGKVIAFIGLYIGVAFNIDGEYIQIIALAVSKEYQNKGIGTELIKKVEQYAISKNISSIGVNSGLHRETAHKFYEKIGFIKKSFSFIKNVR